MPPFDPVSFFDAGRPCALRRLIFSFCGRRQTRPLLSFSFRHDLCSLYQEIPLAVSVASFPLQRALLPSTSLCSRSDSPAGGV